MNTTKLVYIIDDDDSLRESMADFLAQNGYSVHRYKSADAFLANLPNLQGSRDRGVIISDVRMPGRNGLSLLRVLNEIGTGAAAWPVIFVTGHASVPLAVDAMRAGAVHFLEKPVEPDLLLRTIDVAFAAQDVAEAAPTADPAAQERLKSLTPREREVLASFVELGSNKAVANALQMSPRTVEVHRTRILRKSGATSVADLVRIAIEAGILASDHNPKT